VSADAEQESKYQSWKYHGHPFSKGCMHISSPFQLLCLPLVF